MITTTLNTKVLGIENKIPDIPNLVTKSLLNIKATAVKCKIHGIINQRTKAALNTKLQIIKRKTDTTSFITIPEFNGLTRNYFGVIMIEATKCFRSKIKIDAALDIADKNRENIKNFKGFM